MENPTKFILILGIIIGLFAMAFTGFYIWVNSFEDQIEEFEVTCKNTNFSASGMIVDSKYFVLFTDQNGYDVVYQVEPSQSVRFIIGHRYIITVKNGAEIIGIRDLGLKEDDARVKTVSLYKRKIMRS